MIPWLAWSVVLQRISYYHTEKTEGCRLEPVHSHWTINTFASAFSLWSNLLISFQDTEVNIPVEILPTYSYLPTRATRQSNRRFRDRIIPHYPVIPPHLYSDIFTVNLFLRNWEAFVAQSKIVTASLFNDIVLFENIVVTYSFHMGTWSWIVRNYITL